MKISNYEKFLESKKYKNVVSGFECEFIPDGLFAFQEAVVKWALKKGKAAIFADTGLGKTMMQTAWAECVFNYTGNRVLIVAPLCVAHQTVNEAKKIDISPIKYVRSMDDVLNSTGIFITNYEMLDNFDFNSGYFDGIVLDESSILKHQDSKTRTKIIQMTRKIPYKLSCTATPSPNDYMELASQAEFLGIMSSAEMLATFFIHDSGQTSKWRLKGHGESKFWEWLSTWGVYIKKPSDIGYSDDRYVLPELNMIEHIVESGLKREDYISKKGMGLSGRNKARRDSIAVRVKKAKEIADKIDAPLLVWTNLNDESKMISDLIDDAVEVAGSHKMSVKEERINGFTDQLEGYRCLVTKPKIAGFGMNWQHCNNMIFVGLNDSYEQLYQAIRRCYRFGQNETVNVHIISSDIEGDTLSNIKEKEMKAERMHSELIRHMRDFQTKEVNASIVEKSEYRTEIEKTDRFEIFNGDCIEYAKSLEDESIDYCIFSPPFSSLYTYSNSERDMGNSRNDDEFWNHFNFLIPELYRSLRSGRNVSVHCMNLTTSKVRDGYIGMRDFRGDIIRAFQRHGFIYHSEVTIWKNPVVAMQRTKALGLLWKQIKKNSAMCRQGIPDYVVTFRKDGEPTKPIEHTPEQFTVDRWQHIASPCWNDITQSTTLNGKLAREKEDERHIAPLQLSLIERCLDLWSMPGDVVLSPFTGIGSEGYVSLQMGRDFKGSELKKSYYKIAKDNLIEASKRIDKLYPSDPGIYDKQITSESNS